MEQNTGLTNLEITDGNIKDFEKTARKYNIDFALKNAQDGGEIPAFIEERKNEFITAMDDDLNTADALAAVFMLVRDINTTIANGAGKDALNACAGIFDQLTGVLGLVYNRKNESLDSEIEALIEQRKIGSDEVLRFEASSKKIEAIHILPGFTHKIINLSETDDLVTLMWANEQFNPNKPDTFFEVVE